MNALSLVVHSKNNQEVGVAHKALPLKKTVSIFPDDDGAVLVR